MTLPQRLSAPHNLPASPTLFVGRAEECGQLLERLGDPLCRLVSIVGPGGVGKTRLAVECARVATTSLAGRFADGVYLVELADLPPGALLPDLLATTIAGTLGLAFAGGEASLDQLAHLLRPRSLLLVLDNLEQLSDAGPLIADLLQKAPSLAVLATTREPLHLRGEWCVVLSGLPFPAEQTPGEAARAAEGSVEALARLGAVQLFVQTARMVDPAFALGPANAAEIARICQIVEGLPLGIELAGNWLRTLSCAELADELAHGLDILSDTMLDLVPRQRSLRALFESSWRLLAQPEQQALRRLTVFSGSFTRAAAAEVAGAPLPMLAALVDKSLLRRELRAGAAGAGRYRLLEMVRQYAAEQLAHAGETPELEQRHTRFYVAQLAEQVPHLRGAAQLAALATIGAEIAQIRAAWQRACAAADHATIGQAADGLFHFYDMQSWFQEGAAAFAAAADALAAQQASPAVAQVWAHALARQGWFTFHIGRQREAQALLERSLAALRALDARAEMIFPLNYLGAVCAYLGEYAATEALCREGLAIAQSLGDRYGQAIACNILGQAAYDQGQYSVAQSWSQQSLALEQQLGNRWSMAYSFTNLGKVAYITGAYAEARRLLEESLRIRQAMGDMRGMAICFIRLGETALALGAADEAHEHYGQGLSMFRAIGNRWGEASAQTNRMQLALAQGDLARALELMHDALQIALETESLPQVVTLLASAAPLIRHGGDSAWADTLDRLLAAAPTALSAYQSDAYRLEMWIKRGGARRATLPPAPPEEAAVATRRTAPAGHPAGLTAREVEVLRLVAEGLTDAEVADRLIVSRRTVSTHLSAIYGKLQVNSRSAATRFAIEQGIG